MRDEAAARGRSLRTSRGRGAFRGQMPYTTVVTFRSERSMTEPAEAWLRSKGLRTRQEFRAPWGICDLVGVRIDPRRARLRTALGQKRPIGPKRRVALLLSIERPTTTAELQGRFLRWMKASEVRAELRCLEQGGFVEILACGRVRRLDSWAPLQSRIVAIELKLNRVNEALGQSRAHRAFADEVFVGLPLLLATSVAKTSRAVEFEESGVGLLGVTTEGCRVVLRPGTRSDRPDSVLQAHCAERFWQFTPRGTEASSVQRFARGALPAPQQQAAPR
jgi:hypothetical protein